MTIVHRTLLVLAAGVFFLSAALILRDSYASYGMFPENHDELVVYSLFRAIYQKGIMLGAFAAGLVTLAAAFRPIRKA